MALGQHSFFVAGTPQTQGSMRGFVVGNRAVLTSTNKQLKPWRATVAAAAREAGWGDELLDGPVRLVVSFWILRPRGHFKAQGILRSNAPTHPHKHVGDLDKLVRAIGDALTGIVWTDDRRIVAIHASKHYEVEQEGALIEVYSL